MIRTRTIVCASLVALVCAGAVDCSDIIPIPPTQTIADPPPFDSNCASSIVTLTESEFAIDWMIADAKGVYWVSTSDAETGDVKGWESGNLITIAPGEPSPVAITLDDHFIYWTSWNKFQQQKPSIRSWSRDDHTTKTTVEIKAPSTAGGIAVDAAKLYFGAWKADAGGIYSLGLPLDTDAAPQQVVTGVVSPYRLFVDSQNLYFNEGAGDDFIANGVSVASLDGGAVTRLAKATVAADIAVVSNDVYFTGGGLNVVTRIPIDGGQPVVVADAPNPLTMAVDVPNNRLYFIRGDDGTGFSALVRSSLTAEHDTPQECATHLFNATAVAAFGDKVYVASQVATGWAVYQLTVH